MNTNVLITARVESESTLVEFMIAQATIDDHVSAGMQVFRVFCVTGCLSDGADCHRHMTLADAMADLAEQITWTREDLEANAE